MSSSETVTPVLVKAQNGEELSSLDKRRLWNLYMSLFVNWQWEWGEHNLGRFEAPIQAWRNLFQEIPGKPGSLPGLKETWEANKDDLTPEFVEFMDKNVVNGTSD
jgi:hypothetical protein